VTSSSSSGASVPALVRCRASATRSSKYTCSAVP